MTKPEIKNVALPYINNLIAGGMDFADAEELARVKFNLNDMQIGYLIACYDEQDNKT